jgi:hypothetical protein
MAKIFEPSSLIQTPWGLAIVSYFECSKCGDELRPGESMKTKGYLQVGATIEGGFQVWCMRHNSNVVHVKHDQLVSFFQQMGLGRRPLIRTDS